MKLKSALLTGVLLLSGMFVAPAAKATAVTGQANIAGNVTVSGTTVAFAPTFTSTPGAMETGSYSGLTSGTIQSLTGGPVTGNLPTPLTNFLTFTGGLASPISFDLTFLAPGVGSLAGCSSTLPGSSCTPTGSPFTLFQLSSNTVLASLQMNGIAYTGSSATGSSATSVIFSTQTVGTLADIYGVLVSGGSIQGITYSASLISTAGPNIPEPYTIGLMAVGLIAAGLVARRKKSA